MTRDDYIRRAKIVRLVDGDTVDVDIDLGMAITTRQRLRLFGINTPEVRGSEKVAGHAATQHLADLLVRYRHEGEWDIVVQTRKDKRGKYGRYLADLIGEDGDGNPVNLNMKMVADGHAVVAMY
jgi:micrococcal nuclease|tara:strand:- start:1036 stop:1407 length:372 start_codon:yes stop_codon:yes gene_type:complete